MRYAWLSNTRTDIILSISQMAQVNEAMCHAVVKRHIKVINVATHGARNDTMAIIFPRLSFESILNVGYSDASFTGNHDMKSQLGRLMFLMDDDGVVVSISFKPYKLCREVRSVLAKELNSIF